MLEVWWEQDWHDGLIFQSKFYGVESKLLSLLKNNLKNCDQRVAWIVKHPDGKNNSVVPVGSVLGAPLFLTGW